jgi:hypothetical protein
MMPPSTAANRTTKTTSLYQRTRKATGEDRRAGVADQEKCPGAGCHEVPQVSGVAPLLNWNYPLDTAEVFVSRSGWHLRLGLVAIAFAAILLRALVPAGYMLGQAETGDGRYLVVQLCDTHEALATAIDLDTGKVVSLADLKRPGQQNTGTDHSACVFAAAAHFATPLAPQVSPPILDESVVQSDAGASPSHLVQVAFLPPATGPPAGA